MREIPSIDLDFGEGETASDPLSLFQRWYSKALTLDYVEPGAMALATVGPDGQPSVRMVLLKDFNSEGFAFYTNYRSRKGLDLDRNPKAALVFYWDTLHRQVRMEGIVEKLPEAMSDEYFATRPEGSRISAAISEQSQPIDSRAALNQKYAELARNVGDNILARPQHWGGYRLVPHAIEFWQGRPDRLHDRLLYKKSPHGWTMIRLQP
jgi:pyridoxamine 5'-phosphate oxidase